MLKLLASILKVNKVTLDDGVTLLPPFNQTTGYPQGDNLSPILFSVLVNDLPQVIRSSYSTVKVIAYADDVALMSRVAPDIQGAVLVLEKYCELNGMKINSSKTKLMKFRRAGRLGQIRSIKVGKVPIEYVNSFPYLGIVFTPRGKSF